MPVQSSTQPNLTTFTHWSRLFVKYGLLALVVLMVGRVLINSLIAYYRAVNPPPPPPPTVGFGLLPQLSFPRSEEIPQSFELQTPTGGFPQFSDRAKVFYMPKASASLTDHERALQLAAQYDFVFQPEVVNERTYRFTKSDPLVSTLDLDTRDHVFTLKTDYLSRPELILKSQSPSNYEATERVKRFIRQSNTWGADIATASAKITYLKSSGGQLLPAVSASDADFIQVDLNRVPIDDLFPVYTQEGDSGVVSAIVAGFFSDMNSIVYARNRYYPVDYQQVETYPIRPVKNAWKNLQAGEGLVINPKAVKEAVVRQVSLGYYDNINGQAYLQPVYVFEGDDQFLGLVSAVEPEFLQTNSAAGSL